MKVELKEVREKMEEAKGAWDHLKDSREVNNSDSRDDGSDKDESDEFEIDNMKTIRLDDGLGDITDDDTLPLHGDNNQYDDGENLRDGSPSSTDSRSALSATQAKFQAENAALSQRMETLTNELSAAAQLSSSLKSQYVQAAETIHGLEEKFITLEKARNQQRGASSPSLDSSDIWNVAPTSGKDEIMRELESRFTDWKKNFEDSVRREREGWEEERECLRIAVQELERRSLLSQQQNAASSGSSSGRKKRRSKASTISTSSEDGETSEGSEEGSLEGGFVSPVTDDSASPGSSSKGTEDATSSMSVPKRPRSRRRRRAPDGGFPARSTESSSPSEASRKGKKTALSPGSHDGEGEGSELRRRRSWIPFSNTSNSHTHSTIFGQETPRGNGFPHSAKNGATVFEVSRSLSAITLC